MDDLLARVFSHGAPAGGGGYGYGRPQRPQLPRYGMPRPPALEGGPTPASPPSAEGIRAQVMSAMPHPSIPQRPEMPNVPNPSMPTAPNVQMPQAPQVPNADALRALIMQRLQAQLGRASFQA